MVALGIALTIGGTTLAQPVEYATVSNGMVHLPQIKRPADFQEFWQASLSRLAQWPMQVRIRGEQLTYRGTYGKLCSGVYYAPAGCRVSQAVIHIIDHGQLAQRIPRSDGFAHLGLYWYPADSSQQWTPTGLPDRDQYLLREAIADVCQAVNVLLNRPEIASDTVGITGEGLGGLVAMAVAALNPQRTDFVVVDHPWPVCHYDRGDGNPPPPQVVGALAALEARYPQWRGPLRAATTYFEMPAFAMAVRAPVLMLNDNQQPPESPREPQMRLLTGQQTQADAYKRQVSQQPVTWDQVWRDWAMQVKQRSAADRTAGDVGLTKAVANLQPTADKLFVPAEPVSLSW